MVCCSVRYGVLSPCSTIWCALCFLHPHWIEKQCPKILVSLSQKSFTQFFMATSQNKQPFVCALSSSINFWAIAFRMEARRRYRHAKFSSSMQGLGFVGSRLRPPRQSPRGPKCRFDPLRTQIFDLRGGSRGRARGSPFYATVKNFHFPTFL